MEKQQPNAPPAYAQSPPPYPGAGPPAGYAPPPQQGYPPAPQQGYPPQAYPPPQPGYPVQQTYPQQPMIQPQNTTVVMAQPVTHVVRVGGNCPACGVGILSEEYSVAGIILAILFFPWGILCCLAMTEKRCSSCRRVY